MDQNEMKKILGIIGIIATLFFGVGGFLYGFRQKSFTTSLEKQVDRHEELLAEMSENITQIRILIERALSNDRNY